MRSAQRLTTALLVFTLVPSLIFTCAVSMMKAQTQGQSAPVVPAPGELHLPANTRVVQGTVLDAHGAPVPHATVLLKDTKTLQIRSYLAQADGAYHFYGLSTDVNYEVRAETPEFTSQIKQISVFDSHKVIKLDLKIKGKKKS